MSIKRTLIYAALFTILYILDPIRILWDIVAGWIIKMDEEEEE